MPAQSSLVLEVAVRRAAAADGIDDLSPVVRELGSYKTLKLGVEASLDVLCLHKGRYQDVQAVKREFTTALTYVEKATAAHGWLCGDVSLYTPADGRRTPWKKPPLRKVQSSAGGGIDRRGLRLPPLDIGGQFPHLFDLDRQIRLGYDAISSAVRSGFARRPHVLYHGPSGSGKTEITRAFARLLGERYAWFVEASTMSKAGFERELLSRAAEGVLQPFVLLEEVEKARESTLLCLLQVMDGRATVQRVNGRDGDKSASAPTLVIATANNAEKLDKMMSGPTKEDGALSSRFKLKIGCPRPSPDTLRRIIAREVLPSVPGYERRASDPRLIDSLLAGGARLLDAGPEGFLADYLHGCRSPHE